MSTLFVVGTPIGNLDDITFRAVETLKKVEVIAAEDTRHTLQLLNALESKGLMTHNEIKKLMISCRSQNEEMAAKKIIELMENGKDVAYTSDAGTPGISDPGEVLVELVRKAGHSVVPIPGPSAFATLVSVAGSGGKTLIFEGFLSPSPGKRRNRLKALLATGNAIVLYESPFRIIKLLTDIADIESERRLVIGRELTKLHEEIIEGTALELRNNFAERSSIKGEFAVFIFGIKKVQISDEATDN